MYTWVSVGPDDLGGERTSIYSALMGDENQQLESDSQPRGLIKPCLDHQRKHLDALVVPQTRLRWAFWHIRCLLVQHEVSQDRFL